MPSSSFLNSLKQALPGDTKESAADEAAPEQQKQSTQETEQEERPSLFSDKDRWFQSEGKVTIDLYKIPGTEKAQENELVLRAPIAGIDADDIEVTIQGDVVALKGVRPHPANDDNAEKEYFRQECYWGPFSRQVILPEEVDPSRASARLEEGILTIRVPCTERTRGRTLSIEES